ncbi:hypothetical protein EJD97_012713 [Solanum chilense]|uniref:Uncharacterized protein n=1 Tax=Solanum chilense TaxID=4083 RepID=A0A6N2CFP5_SOLCI|nr:hypothetical protein EJD97_012713 [Solanum chilense]
MSCLCFVIPSFKCQPINRYAKLAAISLLGPSPIVKLQKVLLEKRSNEVTAPPTHIGLTPEINIEKTGREVSCSHKFYRGLRADLYLSNNGFRRV